MACFPRGWGVFVAVSMLLGGAARASAGEGESRVFRITVDGKDAGTYTMAISGEKDGVVTMRSQADVKVKYLGGLYTYRYSFSGEETWKDGRLKRFASRCNDDGKDFTVSASSDGKDLRLTVNGTEGRGNADSWLTSYWRLPDPALRKGAVALIDADTGRPMIAKLRHIAAEKLSVSGREQTCAHYQLTGGAQADLWYDAQERLVRKEWMEDGYKTVLELTRIGK